MMKAKKALIALLAVAMLASVLLFIVACGRTAAGIVITAAPTKTSYVAGEKFDPTGMVVSLVYDNDKKKNVTDYTFSPSGKLKASDKSVTVKYKTKDGNEFTARQSIKVHNNLTKIKLKKNPEQTVYVVGETFNPLGMVITATYEDGSSSDIEITSSNAVYKTQPLAKSDAQFVVTYQGKTVTVSLTINSGIFVEAEDGEVITSSNKWIFDDAVGRGDKYDATGGKYVGDLSANDSITFKFVSDSDGKADITFRMASKHITESFEWLPIAIGETQLNKICDISVNGSPLAIGDDVILPGSRSESGNPDFNLWFLWQVVTLNDVNIQSGENTVKLTFKFHDYYDCSWDAAETFNGKFTANVDNIRVLTDCNVEAVFDKITGAKIEEDDGRAAFIIYGIYGGNDCSGLEAKLKQISINLQKLGHDGNGWNYDHISAIYAYAVTFGTAEDGTKIFEAKYDVTDVAAENYASHYGGEGSNYDFKPEMGAYEKTITVGNKSYTMTYVPGTTDQEHYWGCVGIRIDNN